MRKLFSMLLLLPLLGILFATLFVAPAHAQATRTWVSGVGDDVNPCSRTAPCKTFAGAISKTAEGGEISVLDPGGFGTVTITKSISITNDGAGEASILASSTNGINVNAGATDIVNIRGIIIDGAPPTSPGSNGIRFIAGGALHIQNAVIKNFTQNYSSGIYFVPGNTARLTIRDTIFSNNGSGVNGSAITVRPTAGYASVTLTNVTMDNNANGFVGDASATSGALLIALRDSTASANNGNGVALYGGTGPSTMILDRFGSVNNTNGINSVGSNATVLVTNSILTGNNIGMVSTSGGKIISYLNNAFLNNFAPSSPTATQVGQ